MKKVNKLSVPECLERLKGLAATGNIQVNAQGQYMLNSLVAQHLGKQLQDLGHGHVVQPGVDPTVRRELERKEREKSLLQGVKALLKKPRH